MDYKFGNKNNWRRWVWNRLSERITNRSEAIVLFLAGKDALDFEIAVEHGFSPENLIAVEREQETLKLLRQKGILAIDGDILDVLIAWPQNIPVAAVFGDFCCGLEKRILERLQYLPFMSAFCDAVVALNFLRGRDRSSNWLRSFARTIGASDKNRAAQLFMILFISYVQRCKGIAPNYSEAQWQNIFKDHHRRSRPVFKSYKSVAGNQVFDSVVYEITTGEICREMNLIVELKAKPIPEGYHSQRRRISAVLAHRTMRLND